jgi:hypothetical protein
MALTDPKKDNKEKDSAKKQAQSSKQTSSKAAIPAQRMMAMPTVPDPHKKSM